MIRLREDRAHQAPICLLAGENRFAAPRMAIACLRDVLYERLLSAEDEPWPLRRASTLASHATDVLTSSQVAH